MVPEQCNIQLLITIDSDCDSDESSMRSEIQHFTVQLIKVAAAWQLGEEEDKWTRAECVTDTDDDSEP